MFVFASWFDTKETVKIMIWNIFLFTPPVFFKKKIYLDEDYIRTWKLAHSYPENKELQLGMLYYIKTTLAVD